MKKVKFGGKRGSGEDAFYLSAYHDAELSLEPFKIFTFFEICLRLVFSS